MSRTANITVRNSTAKGTITDVQLYHVWKDGNVAEARSLGTLQQGQSSQPPFTTTSGPGGDDKWILFFRSGDALMAMGVTKMNVHDTDDGKGIIFDLTPNGDVSFIKDTGADMPKGTWERAERAF
jgi:hypothetical protein